MNTALLDCTVRVSGPGDYRYGATFRVHGRDVRVRLCRDDYRAVAFAVAETLTGTLRWSRLLTTEPPAAASARDGKDNVVGEFERFARDLAVFALVTCTEDGE
jgi:hypothetical protein